SQLDPIAPSVCKRTDAGRPSSMLLMYPPRRALGRAAGARVSCREDTPMSIWVHAFGRAVRAAGQSAGGDDCVAGHVRLELRNVGANYPFVRLHRFRGIKPNPSHRDYSRLSCDAAATQLGPSAIPAGFSARCWLMAGTVAACFHMA